MIMFVLVCFFLSSTFAYADGIWLRIEDITNPLTPFGVTLTDPTQASTPDPDGIQVNNFAISDITASLFSDPDMTSLLLFNLSEFTVTNNGPSGGVLRVTAHVTGIPSNNPMRLLGQLNGVTLDSGVTAHIKTLVSPSNQVPNLGGEVTTPGNLAVRGSLPGDVEGVSFLGLTGEPGDLMGEEDFMAGPTSFSMITEMVFNFQGAGTANVNAFNTTFHVEGGDPKGSTNVPEPASLVLIGSGLVGYALFSRKRR
jgi:hypothetical protein